MGAIREKSKHGVGMLGVGPEKTGTTWLHRGLDIHPDVWLPPRKELSYFWQDYAFPNENVYDRMTKDSWHHQRHRAYAKHRFKTALRRPLHTLKNLDRLAWDLHNVLKTHDDDWYRSSFRPQPSQMAGEISPQHFFLAQRQVEKVRRLCPNAKIIITLREPSEWIWSFVRMLVKKGELSLDGPDVDAFVDEKINANSFAQSAKRWLSVFPKGQVKIFFYEDMTRDPWAFYCDICAFLGLEPREDARETVGSRVNVGRSMEKPDHLQRRMVEGWRDDVRQLKELLGRLPDEWLAERSVA